MAGHNPVSPFPSMGGYPFHEDGMSEANPRLVLTSVLERAKVPVQTINDFLNNNISLDDLIAKYPDIQTLSLLGNITNLKNSLTNSLASGEES